MGRNKKYVVLLIDIFICTLVYAFSYIIADDKFNLTYLQQFSFYIPFIIANVLFICVFLIFDIYNIIWSYINVKELFNIIIACLISTGIFVIIVYLFELHIRLRSCLLFAATFTLSVVLSRSAYYLLRHSLFKYKNIVKKRLLIIGGGEACNILLREIWQNKRNEFLPIGIVDDEKVKQGRNILGVKILGNTKQIKQIVEAHEVESIIFCIINISDKKRKEILDLCMEACSDVKIIPGVYNSLVPVNGNGIFPKLKNVTMEDLLFRDSINVLENQDISYIKDKIVMVTGGGGSIGSELCMQIAKLNPNMLIICDIYENNVYSLEQKLKRQYAEKLNLVIEIASVRDNKKIDLLIKNYKPHVIFHAAAHKHVPLMESNPEEAVKNNVEGTLNIVSLAQKYEVEKFVLISTDKAVKPTNVMGATKRVCEKIVLAASLKSKKTVFSAVRFGNVLGSNGSVIPLFKEQLEMGGPLTVTHPEVTRYFMTIPEAVSLVITAGQLAKGGEIFVLDMGTPVKIKDLAENLIKLAGKVPYRDIDIKYIGLRPGEKLYEELLVDTQVLAKTMYDKIFIDKFEEINNTQLQSDIKELIDFAKENDYIKVKEKLKTIVPEYTERKNN
ncbi:MAG: polysaccharide biosynthesis protein [Eubacteriaceae bacterium]|nr:polysaccharide biosynthesis protein [Eubacteriaceae bacterium]